MSLLNKYNLTPLFAPTDDKGGTAVEEKSLGLEDTIELLGEEETEDEEVLDLKSEKEKKDKKDGDEKDDEEKEEVKAKTIEEEIEEELEEPDEDKLELVTPVRRKEILAKYPTLFKDFPGLESAYYREQKYAEILPTIEDAEVAVNKAGLLDEYEKDLMNGSAESILKTMKDGDQETFNKIVDDYLPALMRVDEGAYYHIIGNVIKHTVITMVNEGKDSENEDLVSAANIIYKYVFGTEKFTAPGNLSKPSQKNEKESEIEEREQEFLHQQFETHSSGLETKVNNVLKSTIDKNIDPRDSMTDYVKSHAAEEALEELDNLISKDVRFTKIIDRLWEKAFNSNFDSRSMDSIKSAYLSKAKTLLPQVITKARNNALKGLGKRSEEERDRKGPLPVGKARTAASSSNSGHKTGNTDKDKAREIPKGMTSREYLMQD